MPSLKDLYEHEKSPEAFDELGEKQDSSFEQT